MIEATLRKLAETRFFFGHLREENQKADRQDPAAFGYYLSAFLSAGRSVTFALQFEEKAKYDAWFPGWETNCDENERKLLKEMNAHRVAEVKKGGAETTVQLEMVPMVELRPAPAQDPIGRRTPPLALAQAAGLPPSALYFGWFGDNEVGAAVRYFEFNGTKVEAVELCRRYVELLEKLVREFSEMHRT
jgi:hypothetical protein